MTDELNGYKVGDTVEAYCPDDRVYEWTTAQVTRLDASDRSLPYRVKFPHKTYGSWVTPDQIRKLPAAATRLEYRKLPSMTLSDASEWMPLPTGQVVDVTGTGRIEVREAPAHTDAEILAKLREHVAENAGYLSSDGHRILKGEF